jgi:hypothetical protein
VKSLTRAQVDGAEDKVIAWTGGGNDRKMKGKDYLQQFALPNFFFFDPESPLRIAAFAQGLSPLAVGGS